jgi:hypothetical protein
MTNIVQLGVLFLQILIIYITMTVTNAAENEKLRNLINAFLRTLSGHLHLSHTMECDCLKIKMCIINVGWNAHSQSHCFLFCLLTRDEFYNSILYGIQIFTENSFLRRLKFFSSVFHASVINFLFSFFFIFISKLVPCVHVYLISMSTKREKNVFSDFVRKSLMALNSCDTCMYEKLKIYARLGNEINFEWGKSDIRQSESL